MTQESHCLFSVLSCWAALLASICACLLSRLPTRKEKGKCYLKRMLATPSEYVTCSFACPVSFSASVQPHFALFNCFSSCCLALSLAPSLKPFLLALILSTIHLEYRWITNTHFELGFLSTSELSTQQNPTF